MPKIFHKQTSFLIAHTDVLPFGDSRPALSHVQKALQPMILSASGWRKVFAENGDEESTEESISSADKVISAAMAYVFANYLKKQSKKEAPVVT
ncbi:MAG: hypothetical protein JEY91_18585, partial [Spirochaetaceae bacterium]|nr:hypothetical protein [Spirochaetaceae bacterium]